MLLDDREIVTFKNYCLLGSVRTLSRLPPSDTLLSSVEFIILPHFHFKVFHCFNNHCQPWALKDSLDFSSRVTVCFLGHHKERHQLFNSENVHFQNVVFYQFDNFTFTTIHGVIIDNLIIGEPEVECGTDSMLVSLNTKEPFEGHVYVKGHYDTPGCRTDGTNNKTAKISIPYSNCDVRRQRTSSPAGVFLSTIVVITFHPMFVTKVDRAYNVKCFYMAADKVVSSDLEVRELPSFQSDDVQSMNSLLLSTLATELITQTVEMPECKYEVLSDGPTGQAIKYATVGQQVYHKWSCSSEAVDVYCMTVHSCSVEDGQGRRVLLLDENGCPQDKYLMANLNYPTDLAAQVDSMVFKFADKPSLFFQCQIRLSLKTDGECKRTSDDCNTLKKMKREIFAGKKGENVDVFSDTMVVLDVDDGYATLEDLKKLQALRNSNMHNTIVTEAENGVCLSSISFGILVSIVGLLLLTSISASVMVCLRRDRTTLKK
ncbi:Cuticlin-1 [Trichinella nativa]|uniref:Cuticlin-1 n=1 Tax=Trichinella nativa TaxID=6335 RepID=A0A0V1LPE1_9BILA|nr:Cuticlin-1 [Trichinella nativa]